MSDFRGGGGSKKIRLYKVKIGVRGGGGVKNDSKESDIIYEWSLSQIEMRSKLPLRRFEPQFFIFEEKKYFFNEKKNNGKSKIWTCNLPDSSQALYQLSYPAWLQKVTTFY